LGSTHIVQKRNMPGKYRKYRKINYSNVAAFIFMKNF